MNRAVLSTLVMLVAFVGLSLTSGTSQAEACLSGNRCCKVKRCKPARTRCCKPKRNKCCKKERCGLIARLRARKCCKPAPVCCEAAPVCCEAAPSCGCEEVSDCGCGSAAPATGGCANCGDTSTPVPADEAAPAAPADEAAAPADEAAAPAADPAA